jgi:protein phosphatase
LLFGNIGDSSGYVYKKGKLYKVTKDHTLVNILLENGELTESDAKNHPQKNVLMKALGAAERIEMDIFDVERNVDGVLLCSDGLTNMISVEQMEKILGDGELDLEGQVGKMINKANMRGGNDNITVACVRFGGE